MAAADASPTRDPTDRVDDERSTRWWLIGWALLAATFVGAATMVWFDDTWRPFEVVDYWSCSDGSTTSIPMSGQTFCTREVAASWPLGLLVLAGTTLALVVLRRSGHLRTSAMATAAVSYTFATIWILTHLGGTQTASRVFHAVSGRPLRGSRRPRVTAASHWANAAIEEADAVAAFEQLAGDLERLGAPADLVTRARRAALEERGHARTCAGLAGTPAPPVPPVPTTRRRPRRLDLVDLATASYRDGAVNEGAESARLAAAARATGDPRTAAACRRLALDERSHAELAWDTIAWTRTAGGPGIDLALRHTARHLRTPAPGPHLTGDPLTPERTHTIRKQMQASARRRLAATLARPASPPTAAG